MCRKIGTGNGQAVAKRLDSRYQSGRSRDWIKIKNTASGGDVPATVDIKVGCSLEEAARAVRMLVGQWPGRDHQCEAAKRRGELDNANGNLCAD